MTDIYIPSVDQFMNPVIQALSELGGSGHIEEINARVIELSNVSDAQLTVLHNPERGSQTEVEYRMAWARTYLKKYGIIENSARGIWSLTSQGRTVRSIDPKLVVRSVRDNDKRIKSDNPSSNDDSSDSSLPSWHDDALEVLLDIDPSAFERLAQRMLREAGFIQVEVLGKVGDGGIDGKGIMQVSGLLSFHVYFQCKRYRGAVGAGQVRDFRGAMSGRGDKGLLIATGTFTKEAVKEATRDGAPPIDLIDGYALVEKLKELGLGIKTELVTVEKIIINHDWFRSI